VGVLVVRFNVSDLGLDGLGLCVVFFWGYLLEFVLSVACGG